MKVLFVAGIHGVGKTTICESISRKLEVAHFSASQLIVKEQTSAIEENTKLVTNLKGNQRLLLQGIAKLANQNHLILDGHFTMRRKSDECLELIDVGVFQEINLVAIIVYIDNVERIARRMLERDGYVCAVEQLKEHQNTELAQAKFVASALRIPLTILDAFDSNGLEEAVSELLL
jgi:adenylate kinase